MAEKYDFRRLVSNLSLDDRAHLALRCATMVSPSKEIRECAQRLLERGRMDTTVKNSWARNAAWWLSEARETAPEKLENLIGKLA